MKIKPDGFGITMITLMAVALIVAGTFSKGTATTQAQDYKSNYHWQSYPEEDYQKWVKERESKYLLGFNDLTNGVVTWQYDSYRKRIAEHDAAVERMHQFNKTNHDWRMNVIPPALMFDWRPQKGERELGYRSDGLVVWRLIPESNK